MPEREQRLHPGGQARAHQRPAQGAARGRAARQRPGAQRVPQAPHQQEHTVVATNRRTQYALRRSKASTQQTQYTLCRSKASTQHILCRSKVSAQRTRCPLCRSNASIRRTQYTLVESRTWFIY